MSVWDQRAQRSVRPSELELHEPAELARVAETVVRQQIFDDFYVASRDNIARALAFTVGSVSLAEEATDEAMARAFQDWSTIREYGNPAGWVYRTGLNWARSRRRSAFRRQRREERLVLDLTSPVHIASGETQDLFSALDSLSHEHRSVVVLRHYCDWTVADNWFDGHPVVHVFDIE